MKKAIIVYYSYSGNTEKAAGILSRELSGAYQTEIARLEARDESGSFFAQAMRALLRKKAVIGTNTPLDLSGYDFIAVGTPVWALGPAPAVRTFLSCCRGLENKPVLFFATYGSGLGKEKCIRQMSGLIKRKSPARITSALIQQETVNNAQETAGKLRKALENG